MALDFRTWLVASDSSTTKIQRNPAGEDFESWFLANGGYLHPSVEIASGDEGNIVRVKQDHTLLPGSMVVSCPHELTISWPGINEYHFPHVRSTFTSHIATRLFLMKQYLLREQSPWWPYINSLPLSFSTPLWYDEDDLVWLRGTNLGKATEIRKEAWRQEYENAMQLLFADGFGLENMPLWTWELYLRAATVMTTRSFSGPASFNRTSEESLVARDHVGRCPILIPGLDILNHDPSAKVSWLWDANVCALRVEEPTHGGRQVWNNYDPKSNEELIMGYGFSLSENISDHYSLGFSPSIAAYIKATKARRLAHKPDSDTMQGQSTIDFDDPQRKPKIGTVRSGGQVLESIDDVSVEETLEQNIHWVRLFGNDNYQFSPQFLENFSIAVENPREVRMANYCLASKKYLSDRSMSRNTLHVVSAIIMILQKGQREIRIHDKELPEAPQNSKQVDAARYRDSQLRILDTVLNSMCKFLKSVTTTESPNDSESRVVRLEHIFTTSPKDLLKDLRGILNAGLRTRDPMKIRDRGGVDFAFTMWLCGLWVYSQSDPRREDEIDPKYVRWLHFLQLNYPEPSEESTHQRPVDSVHAVQAEWFDPVRSSASDDTERDSGFTARSYLDAVRAATEKRPQSIYNDGRITLLRLEWCLNVVKSEGVWCPSLDQGGEEDDDWVIYLERGDC
ncbi:hypothetical protein BDR22DRAFT_978226 [Usnea florida]